MALNCVIWSHACRAQDSDSSKQRIADLERELRLRDERISELRDEVDEGRELVRAMEEHVQERDEYLETFISAFGLDAQRRRQMGRTASSSRLSTSWSISFNDLVDRYNKLVRDYNQYAMPPQPVGRPIAASEAQQAQVLKHHKAGKSARWIAEEMTLSRRR